MTTGAHDPTPADGATSAAEPDLPMPADDDEASPRSRLVATAVRVEDRRRALLPPTSLELDAGELVVGYGDPDHAHVALALALGGRLALDGGTVTVDGDDRVRSLQARVALVDVPGVSEPDDLVPTTTIVGEELAMARRRARRGDVRAWLAEHDLTSLEGTSIEDVPGGDRVALLARLAALRPVGFLVVVLPERHGVLPPYWLPALGELAASGPGILVTTSTGVAAHVPPAVRTVAIAALEEATA